MATDAHAPPEEKMPRHIAQGLFEKWLKSATMKISMWEGYSVMADPYRSMLQGAYNQMHMEATAGDRAVANAAQRAGRVGVTTGDTSAARHPPPTPRTLHNRVCPTVSAEPPLEVDAEVGNAKGRLTLDTGSAFNVIEEKFLSLSGAPRRLGPGKNYSGVDGVSKTSLGTCPLTITLGQGRNKYTTVQDFIVIPNGSHPSAPFSVLMGTPFLRATKATIDMGAMQLHIMRDAHNRLTFPLDTESSSDSESVRAVHAQPLGDPPSQARATRDSEADKETARQALMCFQQCLDQVPKPNTVAERTWQSWKVQTADKLEQLGEATDDGAAMQMESWVVDRMDILHQHLCPAQDEELPVGQLRQLCGMSADSVADWCVGCPALAKESIAPGSATAGLPPCSSVVKSYTNCYNNPLFEDPLTMQLPVVAKHVPVPDMQHNTTPYILRDPLWLDVERIYKQSQQGDKVTAARSNNKFGVKVSRPRRVLLQGGTPSRAKVLVKLRQQVWKQLALVYGSYYRHSRFRRMCIVHRAQAMCSRDGGNTGLVEPTLENGDQPGLVEPNTRVAYEQAKGDGAPGGASAVVVAGNNGQVTAAAGGGAGDGGLATVQDGMLHALDEERVAPAAGLPSRQPMPGMELEVQEKESYDNE
jgi:hypothetical protein